MHPGHAFELLDHLDADPDSLRFRIRGPLHPLYQIVRKSHARNLAHPSRHLDRLDGQHAGQEVRLFMQPLLPDLVHPGNESRQLVDRLGLDEVGTRPDLLGQGDHVEFQRISERVGHRADEERHVPRDRLAIFGPVLVPHRLEHLNQLDRVDVVGTRGSRMVAQALVVTGQA